MVQGFSPLTLGLAAVSLAVSAVGVWASIRFAHRAGVIDVPNERSSHAVPTPRMGGVPMVGAAGLSFGCWFLLSPGVTFSPMALFCTLLFALGMSILGLWDDLSDLSPLFRFLVQFACAVLMLWTSGILLPDAGVAGVIFPTAALVLAGAVWTVWMLNLYNFMDGIDGLAGGEAALSSSFFFLIFSYYGESGWAAANLFIAAASMGFLVHNWPPARVFMGDAGSAFLGAFYGMQSVAAAVSTPIPFLVLIIPFFNFIIDTSITLFRRILRNEKWYEAHRSHFYQRAAKPGVSHAKVTGLEMISAVFSCLAAFLYIGSSAWWRALIVIVVILSFVSMGVWITRKENSY